ncbi:MAG: glycosyltransferase family 39 protein, partial [Geothrix sp.]|nr:glycosyltransferase family 39 protein [Geothrix sp.]
MTLVCRTTKDGLASAVIEGARAARAEVVVVMDADLSHPPEILPQLIAPLAAGTHDMVIGSRYSPGGSTPDWPLGRRIASWLATVPARILTDPQDPLAGFFSIRRQHLAGLDGSVSGFKIALEALVAGGEGLRVAEVPIVFYDRYKGKSKMNRGIIFDYFRQLLTLIGARPAPGFAAGCGAALCLGGLLDFLVFFLLRHQGLGPAAAQMGSFAAASLVIAYIHQRLTFPVLGRRHAGGYLLVALLSLFLRGGLLGDLLRLGLAPSAAMLITIPASIAATIAGLLFVAGQDGKSSPDVRRRLFWAGLIACSVILRLLYLGLPSLLEEEAYYWNYAQHPAMGYLDHPPMVAVLIRIGTQLFATSEFGVRSMSLVCWMTTAGFCSALTRSLYGRLAGFGAVLLVSVMPVFFFTGMMMTPDAPLTACWAGLLYFLFRALLLSSPRAWLGVGICLGLGMFSKYTIVLLGPGIVLFMLIDPQSRRWLIRPGPYLAVLIALLLFSPVIFWNSQHNWASFVFQGERRVKEIAEFSTHILLGQILLLLTPAGLLGLAAFCLQGRSLPLSRPEGEEGRVHLFFLLLLAAPLAVFTCFSLSKEVQLNWTGPLWLALIPFLAASLTARGPAFVRWCARLWPATAVGLLLLFGLFLQYYSLGLPGVPTASRPFLSGWEEMARTVDQIVADEQQKTGKRPLVVGMDKYRLASGLAFYRTRDAGAPGRGETLSWSIFDLPGLMYAYWFEPAMLQGRDLLLVATSRDVIEGPIMQNHVRSMDPIQTL